ncbi:MAG: polysaccharide deacetylase [Rhodospirillaceae bacterium]|nr:polysaccharide deacetylase [Rhodospirillaceae bacterium]OUX30216.1 MAG: polysaccharide deacetylase [Rhodospirillaceae bacterium TMED256]
MKSDPGHYDYWPYINRPKLTWPEGKKIAFWVAPNIENYEFDPPFNPHRRAMPRPLPDVIHYSHRDYGNRAGFWRMLEVMEQYGVRGSVSLNVATLDHHPEVIEACKERDWEFFSHGIYNTRYLYGMNEAQERAYIEDVIESIKKHTGQRVIGSLTPAITHTERSIPMLAEYDFTYVCDLFHDDQPVPLNVPKGKMISMPYSVELNDFTLFNGPRVTPRQFRDVQKGFFDRLLEEADENGSVMCIPTHPFLIGRPFRLDAFAEALEYITGHKEVWVTTSREIADYYFEHHYDAAVGAIAEHKKEWAPRMTRAQVT